MKRYRYMGILMALTLIFAVFAGCGKTSELSDLAERLLVTPSPTVAPTVTPTPISTATLAPTEEPIETEKRLSSIVKFNQDGIMEYEYKFEYDGPFLSSIVQRYSENDEYTEQYRFMFNEKGYVLYREFGDGYTMEYTYDNEDKLIHLSSVFGMEIDYEYDEFGNLVKEIAGNEHGNSVKEYAYDNGVLIAATEKYTESGSSTNYQYAVDEQGRLRVEKRHEVSGTYISRYEYDYKPFLVKECEDPNSKYQYIVITDALGQSLMELRLNNPQYTVDQDGYIIQIMDTEIFEDKSVSKTYEIYYNDASNSISLPTPTFPATSAPKEANISVNDIIGEWEANAELTEEKYGYWLGVEFGTLMRYGSSMKIGADNSFSYYIAGDAGGTGTWSLEDHTIVYQITRREPADMRVNDQIQIYTDESGETYLVMPSGEIKVCWTKVS